MHAKAGGAESTVFKLCSGTTPECRSPRLRTRALSKRSTKKKSHFSHTPNTHTSFRQTLHTFRTAKNGIECYQNRRQGMMLELVKSPWQLLTTAGLFSGPNTGAAPVHEEPLGPAQTLHDVYLLQPQPRGILVPAPGDGILMPELTRRASLPPWSGYQRDIGSVEERLRG